MKRLLWKLTAALRQRRGLARQLVLISLLLPALSAQAQVDSVTTLSSSANPSSFGAGVTLTASVTGDNPSGSITFMDGATAIGSASLSAGQASLATSSLAVGSHSLTAVYEGDAGNNPSTSAALNQVVNQASTTTTVASSLNPASYGASVTFTATVTGQSPSGQVTFMDGATTLGTGTLTAGQASFASSALTVGSHSITAVYAGDTNNAASTSGAISQVVNQGSSTTTLASSANPATYSQSITLTASVAGTNPTGSVTFKDGTTTLGTGSVSGGQASFTTSALAGGTHSLTAVYAGDANNAGSTSAALAQVINKYTTTTALTSSLNPSTAGQAVTLTASVTGASPTGSVTFKDGTNTIGSGTLNAGVATLTLSTLNATTHSLTAVYAGDTNNAGSTSAAVAQVVNKVNTTMTLSIPQSQVTVGANVTMTATVIGYNTQGTIPFKDGATTLGSPYMYPGTSSSSVTFSTASLAVGTHSLNASYAGDTNNLPAAAAPVTLTVVPRSGVAMQYGYDAMGRLTTTIDANGLASYLYYDSLGRAIQSQQQPNTGSSSPTLISYGYDLADALTGVTDPRNLATSYSPNGLGSVASQTSPDSGASQFTYDASGNLLTSTDARGKLTQYSYDALNRLTTVSYASGTATTFEYDGGANPTPGASGELTKMSDESGQTSYAYDDRGRLTGKTVGIGAKTFTVAYGWGDAGSATDKLISITYPSGNQVNYSYDEQGALSAISVNPVNPNGVGVNPNAQTLLSNLSYNAEKKITGWLWSDGKARTIGYNSYGQIASYSLGDSTGIGNAAGVLRTIQRDPVGRITGYTHSNNGNPVASLDQTFSYDNLNRLTSTTQASSTTQYSYDATGNRTSKTIGGTTYTNTVAATSNRYTQVQDVGGTASVQHDAAGHIQGDGSFTYSYSDRGRMSSVTTAGGTVSYLYDGRSQRVYKSGPTAVVPTGASYYVYDEAGQLLGEYDANGNPVYETIYLGSLPVGALKQTGSAATNDIAVSLYNVNADHIATPRVITQQDETIVWRWDAAEAFGATAPDQNPSNLGTFVYNQRFPGQVFDVETGLNQNWNREYNARWGRYMQTDPIGLRGGINTFSYAGSDPLSGTDADGRKPFWPESRQPSGPMSTPSADATSAGAGATSDAGSDVCFNDCAAERQACTSLCLRAKVDFDLPKVWGGSFNTCMRSCLPARCGGF